MNRAAALTQCRRPVEHSAPLEQIDRSRDRSAGG
jgi:hypothetical protein